MSRADQVIQPAQAGADDIFAKANRAASALLMEAVAGERPTRRPATGPLIPDKVRDLLVERPVRRSLDSLVLPPHVEMQVRDLIEEQHEIGQLRAHSLEPRHRVVLAGPPGNGKTTLAEAIAHALGVPFLTVLYEAVIGSDPGETRARLNRVFAFARSLPCVLLLDDFDTFGMEPGRAREIGEIKSVLSSILVQMDDWPSNTVIVCASNSPDALDSVVWRRFQLKLELPMPTREDLCRWLELVRADGKAMGMETDAIARELEGVSFAEAEEFLLDVKRKIVLTKGTPEAVVAQQLLAWKNRSGAKTY